MLMGGLLNDAAEGNNNTASSYRFVSFGARGEYIKAPFYAEMNVRYGVNLSDHIIREGEGNFQLQPILKYAIIRDTLLARVGFIYTKGVGGNGLLSWQLVPGVYWNLNRNADTHDPSRGIRLSYTLGKTSFNGSTQNMLNDIDLSFHWSF